MLSESAENTPFKVAVVTPVIRVHVRPASIVRRIVPLAPTAKTFCGLLKQAKLSLIVTVLARGVQF
jgi:hypothetical protein